MALADRRAASAKMAKYMADRGIFHGKRLSTPAKNSGGTTQVFRPGSSKYHRYVDSRINRNAA